MCSMHLFKGILGCAGGFLMHLVLGSVYQWGIINVYISSYFSIIQGVEQSLTVNGAVFPAMMMCIGLGMKLGNYLSQLIGLPYLMGILSIVMSSLVFASSYITSFAGFVILYGVLFGFFGGMCFTSTMREINKYFINKQIYVNGFVLVGTGLGSAVFGPFSYGYLNPNKLSPVNGLYIAPGLQQIALKVPSCIRYLSLFYIVLGLIGSFCVAPIYFQNKKKDLQNQNKANNISATQVNLNQDQNKNEAQEVVQQPKVAIKTEQLSKQIVQNKPQLPVQIFECPNFKTAFSTRNTYMLALVYYTMIIGNLFVNTSYKTYVRRSISNDQFLTLVGAFASIANGVMRFPSSLLFNKVGFKIMVSLLAVVNITIYSTIRLAIFNEGVYCFLIIMCNVMLGTTLAIGPTQLLKTFGARTGSDIYTFFWCCFAIANFTAYGLANAVDLNILFYVFAGASGFSAILVWFIQLQIDWNQKLAPIEIQMQSLPVAA